VLDPNPINFKQAKTKHILAWAIGLKVEIF
jgi:hypothetical protein